MENNINFFIEMKLYLTDHLNSLNKLNDKNNDIQFLEKLTDNENELLNEYFNFSNTINANQHIEKLEKLLDNLTNHIEEHCRHDFETDYVELNQENMKLICYCKICGANI